MVKIIFKGGGNAERRTLTAPLKVGFGESLKIGQQVGPEEGFSCEVKRKTLLPDLLFDLL